jgi:hypothetical protein
MVEGISTSDGPRGRGNGGWRESKTQTKCEEENYLVKIMYTLNDLMFHTGEDVIKFVDMASLSSRHEVGAELVLVGATLRLWWNTHAN